ncbi:MAG: ATP-binding cassette domain-containing protein [Firmicutes bacterium]|nr:ATP-binding cassette domain-containing protein [Bacillota bacterium]
MRLEARGLGYTYPAVPQPAVQPFDLTVTEHSWISVIGPSGSGKSTLAKLLAGLLPPTEGTLWVDGLSTTEPEGERRLRSQTAVIFSNPQNQFLGASVEEDIAFGPENLGLSTAEIAARVDAAIAALQLEEVRHRAPHELSGGQMQRVALAGALAMQSTLLILDEPTAMLDRQGAQALVGTVEQLYTQGHGIVWVTHDLIEAAHAQCVLILERGKLVATGDPQKLLVDETLLAQVGLSLPPVARLAAALEGVGFPPLGRPLQPAALVERIWACR